ncbi:uncharacterized protein LOC134236637, partial [Saccostrea cucullata]|uniref:uncharacterized protein LOC134236637 n=1 Tax=Saccostrea cuccullata TaxID=36930 RepID=UPI002ED44846
MELCYNFALCQSVDWNLDYKTCRLNTRSATVYPSLRVTTPRTIHVDSEHFPDEVSGDCFNHTCDNTSMCVSGNCVPVLEGRTCDSPPEIPNTEQPSPPGLFPVGYTYNYSSCLDGHEPSGELYTTCQDNGQWTTALFRCIVDQDCTAILYKNLSLLGQDGVYTIYPDGFGIQVYCDMTTELGGWT